MRFFNVDLRCSASVMFANNNIMSLGEQRRKSIYRFQQRITFSKNPTIISFMSASNNAGSKLWQHVLFCITTGDVATFLWAEACNKV